MADVWHRIEVGVKVEVENTDMDEFCDEFPTSFWIASIIRIEGDIIFHLNHFYSIKFNQSNLLSR